MPETYIHSIQTAVNIRTSILNFRLLPRFYMDFNTEKIEWKLCKIKPMFIEHEALNSKRKKLLWKLLLTVDTKSQTV